MSRYFFVLLLICSSSGLLAQKDTIANLNEVVVTATKRNTKWHELPYAAVSLNRSDLEKNLSRTLPESLQGVAGVFIQKTNHGGGSPFVRGLTGNQTLLMVDGIRLNNSIFRYGPNQYLTLVDPLLVERVEVVKGTGAVQYGSDALTGVINVLTRSPQFADQPKWSARLTSRLTETRMEQSLRPELSYSGKRIAFLAGASVKQFGHLKGGDTTGFQVPSGYDEKAADVKLKIDLGRSWIVTSSFNYLRQDDVPVYHRYRLENFRINDSDPLKRALTYVRLEKNFNAAKFKSLNITLSKQSIAETRILQRNNSNTLRTEVDKAMTLGAVADLSHAFNRFWTANSGVEVFSDRVNSERTDLNITLPNEIPQIKRGLYPDDARYLNAAVYSLHHLTLNRFNIEAGARYHAYQIRINDADLGKVNVKPDALVFQSAVSYALTDKLRVYGNLSSGYRAPNIDDMGTLGVVDFRYEVPAYDLRPESSLTKEIGVKWTDRSHAFSAAYFHTGLNNLINRIKTAQVISGYSVYIKENAERGFIRGWEAEAQIKLSSRLRFNAMAAYLFGQNETRSEPLRRIPPFNSSFRLHYQSKWLQAGFVADQASFQSRLAQGDKDDNRIPRGGTPGFCIFNMYAGTSVRNLSMRIYLNNLLNDDYRTHGSGINGMGRACSLLFIWNINP